MKLEKYNRQVRRDSGLKFDIHVNEETNNRNLMPGKKIRILRFLSLKVFLLLYCALVRLHLEYTNAV